MPRWKAWIQRPSGLIKREEKHKCLSVRLRIAKWNFTKANILNQSALLQDIEITYSAPPWGPPPGPTCKLLIQTFKAKLKYRHRGGPGQGTVTEGEGSVQLTSSITTLSITKKNTNAGGKISTNLESSDFRNFLIQVWLNLKTIKFYLIKLT
jgi:hypothetical protein